MALLDFYVNNIQTWRNVFISKMTRYNSLVYFLDTGLMVSNIHVILLILLKGNRLDGPGLFKLTERMTERLFPIMREQQTFLDELEKLKHAASSVPFTVEKQLSNKPDTTRGSKHNPDNPEQAIMITENERGDPSHANNVIIGQPSSTNHHMNEQDVVPSEEHEVPAIPLQQGTAKDAHNEGPQSMNTLDDLMGYRYVFSIGTIIIFISVDCYPTEWERAKLSE